MNPLKDPDLIVTDDKVFFWGSPFSNWFMCNFEMYNKRWKNSEAAFMFHKAMMFADLESAAMIEKNQKPHVVKRIGRGVKNYEDDVWSDARYEIMVDVVKAKFKQNSILFDYLMFFDGYEIVEASPEDDIWGIGIGMEDDRIFDRSKWNGENLLGKALMEAIESFKADFESNVK